MFEQGQELVGLAGLREQDGHVVRSDNAKIAVHTVHRMQEDGGRSRGRERCRDLATNQPGLANAGDDDAPDAGRHHQHRVREARIEPFFHRRE